MLGSAQQVQQRLTAKMLAFLLPQRVKPAAAVRYEKKNPNSANCVYLKFCNEITVLLLCNVNKFSHLDPVPKEAIPNGTVQENNLF